MKENSTTKAGKLLTVAFVFMLFASEIFAASVSLSWDASPSTNVSGYTVYYGTASGNYTAQTNAGTGTRLVLQGINRQANYFFTVTARSVEGEESLFSNEVNLQSEKNPPQVNITSPGSTFSTLNSTVNISGTASDDFGLWQITWSNQCSRATGVASGTANWSAANISLCLGTNRISVVARDGAGNVANALVTIIRKASVDNAPQIAITFPTAGSTFQTTNSSVNLMGNATDDQSLAQINWTNQCTLASGLASGTTSWSASNISLCLGTNRLSVTARDGAGKVTTVSLIVVRQAPSGGPCDYFIGATTAEFSASGGVRSVAVATDASCGWTAIGGSDWVQITSANAGTGNGVVTFNVSANSTCSTRQCVLTIAGNDFTITQAGVESSIESVVGSFNTLFAKPSPSQSSGFFNLKKGNRTSFSGSIKLEGMQYSFSGKFDSFGFANTTINRSGAAPLTLQLVLQPCSPDNLLATLSDGSWTTQFPANRDVSNALKAPAPLAGKYTLAIVKDNSGGFETSPQGIGFAAIKVLSNGQITVAGNLGDGEKFMQSAFLSKDGTWPCYVPLYRNAGVIFGTATFQSRGVNPEGNLTSIKPALSNQRFYPAGFSTTVAVIGSPYSPPIGRTNRVLNFENGTFIFDGNNPAGGLAKDVRILPDNKIVSVAPGDDKLSVRIKKDDGTFTGTIKLPGQTRPLNIKGAFLQNQNSGYGLLLGTDQSREILFEATH